MKLSHVLGLLSLLLGLTFGLSAKADPDPIVQYLMDEPVSMWTYGLDKIEAKLNDLYDGESEIDKAIDFISVDYDWNTNQIIISAGIDVNEANSFGSWKEQCKAVIESLRSSVAFIIVPFGHYFSQNGFHKNTQPEDISTSLRKITQVQVIFGDASGKIYSHKCEASFAVPTADILFSE